VTDRETGEIRELNFRWIYVKEGESVDQVVHQEQHQKKPEMV
jgi:hypothetical protein